MITQPTSYRAFFSPPLKSSYSIFKDKKQKGIVSTEHYLLSSNTMKSAAATNELELVLSSYNTKTSPTPLRK